LIHFYKRLINRVHHHGDGGRVNLSAGAMGVPNNSVIHHLNISSRCIW